MSVKIIYFVHGTTTDNLEHKASGWEQGQLSSKGIEQVLNLKEILKSNEIIDFSKIDLVISSDLKRAIDSANYLFEGEKEILHDERIRECTYGELSLKDNSLVKYEEHIEEPFPNGESLKDVEKRMKNFTNYLLEKYNGKTIALVAHKAPQLALDVITKGMTWQEAIDSDWRKTKNWQPGWMYEIK